MKFNLIVHLLFNYISERNSGTDTGQSRLVLDGSLNGTPLERRCDIQYRPASASPQAMETLVILALCFFCALIIADVAWTLVRLHRLNVRETTSGTYSQALAEDIVAMPSAQTDVAVTIMTPPPSVPELTKAHAAGEKARTPKSPWRRLSSSLSFFKRPSPLSAAEV